jgi:hypothetical protein
VIADGSQEVRRSGGFNRRSGDQEDSTGGQEIKSNKQEVRRSRAINRRSGAGVRRISKCTVAVSAILQHATGREIFDGHA